MAKTFHLTIARVGENLYDGEAVSVSLPGAEGMFVVYAGHEALVSELKEGDVGVEDTEGKRHTFGVTGGIAEISQNQTTVLL